MDVCAPVHTDGSRWDVWQVDPAKLVLLILNGEPCALDKYKPTIPTIVEGLEGGQAGGTALAEMLFGDFSPSGTLPFTVLLQ